MSSFCPHCGKPAHDGAAFCPTTGAPIGGSAGAPQVVPPGVAFTSDVPAPPTARYQAPVIEDYSVGAVIGLSIVTCGIFGLVRFYQAAQSYRRLEPGSAPNFEWQFWTYVFGSMAASVLGLLTIVGYVLYVPVIIVGCLMLAEVCKARERLAGRIGAPIRLRPAEVHVTLWAVGYLLSVVIVGVILLLVQATFFFQEHSELARRYGSRPV